MVTSDSSPWKCSSLLKEERKKRKGKKEEFFASSKNEIPPFRSCITGVYHRIVIRRNGRSPIVLCKLSENSISRKKTKQKLGRGNFLLLSPSPSLSIGSIIIPGEEKKGFDSWRCNVRRDFLLLLFLFFLSFLPFSLFPLFFLSAPT